MNLSNLTWSERTAINVKIAEFLKWEKSTRYSKGYMAFNRIHYQVLPEELKFHMTWDWLMDAIESIEEKLIFYNAGYKLENEEYIQSFEKMLNEISEGIVIHKSKILIATDLEIVLNAVIIFIDWYNNCNLSES